MTKIKVLVADDEPAIRKLLERGLSSYGYEVTAVSNGTDALSSAARHNPHMILLDVSLQSEPNGLEVCRQLREWNKIPIIMLTVRDEKPIRLAALNAGADDYITKPFDMDELEARIRAVLRRGAMEAAQSPGGEIRIHELVIDLVNRRVTLGGEAVHLTPKEYDLLRLLASHAGRVLTFRTLLESVWGHMDSPNPEHNVRVYINTIRKKLKDDPANTHKPRYIYNEPGIGYRFADA
ncbi:MAG: response regulator transcription factor [Chloroflexota bacterium]